MDTRESHDELNWLLGAIAKAFDISAEEASRGVESGDIAISLDVDERGERFVAVRHRGKAAHIYQGAVHYEAEGKPGR
jgi:hypothetical protein